MNAEKNVFFFKYNEEAGSRLDRSGDAQKKSGGSSKSSSKALKKARMENIRSLNWLYD